MLLALGVCGVLLELVACFGLFDLGWVVEEEEYLYCTYHVSVVAIMSW